MRAVGSILLAISQTSENAISRQRALSQLNVLVDILARLDSRASDKLAAQLPHAQTTEFTAVEHPWETAR
jgi:hypothetical protein